jgi:hypothetical protein
MKLSAAIILFVVSAWVSLILSSLIFTVAWNIRIEGRSFHCTDDVGFCFFWQDLHVHEAAGDTVSPGWTWEKIGKVKLTYEVAFLAMWAVSGILLFVGLRRFHKMVGGFPTHGALHAEADGTGLSGVPDVYPTNMPSRED